MLTAIIAEGSVLSSLRTWTSNSALPSSLYSSDEDDDDDPDQKIRKPKSQTLIAAIVKTGTNTYYTVILYELETKLV